MASAIAKPEPRRYTISEYLAYEQEAAEKHEYRDGQIIVLTGEAYNHAVIAANLFGELGQVLKGTPCRAADNSVRIRMPPRPCTPMRTSALSAASAFTAGPQRPHPDQPTRHRRGPLTFHGSLRPRREVLTLSPARISGRIRAGQPGFPECRDVLPPAGWWVATHGLRRPRVQGPHPLPGGRTALERDLRRREVPSATARTQTVACVGSVRGGYGLRTSSFMSFETSLPNHARSKSCGNSGAS